MSVSPPAQGQWWDLAATSDDVMARLRLQHIDVDKDRISDLVPVAAGLINNELDRCTPMTPAGTTDVGDVDGDGDTTELLATNVTPSIIEALSRLVIELYAEGKTDLTSPIGVPSTEAGGVVDAVAAEIGANKSRWGIA